jgi:hypothetical protein
MLIAKVMSALTQAAHQNLTSTMLMELANYARLELPQVNQTHPTDSELNVSTLDLIPEAALDAFNTEVSMDNALLANLDKSST